MSVSSTDLLVHNARIYTVDNRRSTATAFAVQNGRFVDVGTNESLRAKHCDASSIDARGYTIIPGFVDAHAHLHGLGLFLRRADLNATESAADVVERLKSFESEHDLADGAWLRGHGWDQNDWKDRSSPSRRDLDDAFPNRPVWLTRTDVHAGWANTAALEASVGFDSLRTMDDPDGGHIRRGPDGDPTGVLVDEAMTLVEDSIPTPGPTEMNRALSTALEHTARHGITALHDAGTGLTGIRRYQRFLERDQFPLRVYAMVDGRKDAFEHFLDVGPLHHPSGRLDVESVKFFADGALGSCGAALLEDYSDDPGNRGFLLQSRPEFLQTVCAATEAGFQVNTHAIGDRANRFVLDVYEDAADECDTPLRRPRIEHAQIVAPADRPRFGALGVIACVQPLFATSDMGWAATRLGSDRVRTAYAWKSLRDAGARLAFSSDAPVESIDPLRGFHAAVTRQDASGHPNDGWRPEERLSRSAALRAYTQDAAYAACKEDELGSITPGKRADFVVLSEDIMTVPPSNLLDTEVVATYLDGAPIYARSDWPHG